MIISRVILIDNKLKLLHYDHVTPGYSLKFRIGGVLQRLLNSDSI